MPIGSKVDERFRRERVVTRKCMSENAILDCISHQSQQVLMEVGQSLSNDASYCFFFENHQKEKMPF